MFHSSHSHSHTQNRTQPPQSLLHTRLHNHSKSSFCRQSPHTSLHTMASPQHDHLPSFLTVWFFFFLPLFSSLSLSLCINFVHQLCSTALLLNCFFYFYFFYMIKVMVLKILITLSSKNWNLTEIDWNWNTTKTDNFQPFRSVSVENFTNQNIWFRLAIHIQNRLNQTEHTSNPISKKYHILLSQKLLYLLYHTILQYIWLLNFYFTIQHIKIIYLHNKIIYLKIISILFHFSSLSKRDARTRRQRSRSHVRRSATEWRVRDATDRASVLCRAASCHVFFFSLTHANATQTRADSSRIESYRPNIGVFRLEKGNRLVRKKKKNLK